MIRAEDHDIDMLQVAYLLSKGYQQTQIAEMLNMTPSRVSRLVTKAVSCHILQHQHPALMLEPDEIDWIESKLHHAATLVATLQKKSQERCRHVELIYPRSPLSQRQNYVREVAAGAASFLIRDVLPGKSNVGLMWGVTLSELCRELAELIRREPRTSALSKELKFHQCAGDTRDASDDPSRRAGTLVAELNHVLGTHGHTFSIGAAIPKAFDAEIAIIRRYLSDTPGYSSMFALNAESEVRLKKSLDAIITGCGDGTEHDNWRDESARAAGIEPETLTAMVDGNVGGSWIPSSPEYEESVAEINKHWNGVSTADLQRTISRGGEVILVAAEPSKAKVITRAIELGYVSTLIASFELVKNIIELLGPAAQAGADAVDAAGAR